jgi:uncharacterized membrane protein
MARLCSHCREAISWGMPLGAVLLVLLSAALHASWNFLLKRAGGTQEVVALSKVAEVGLLAPIFVIGFAHELPSLGEALWWSGVAAVGVAANYIALANAYRYGDLSFVYPIARGAILVFLPLAAWLALGERLSLLGAAGLAAIVTGILALNLPGRGRVALRGLRRAVTGRATVYAALAGFFSAVFTVWDKRAIERMQPFAYMYLYTFIVAVGYAIWLRVRVPREVVRRSWQDWWPSIAAIGVMNTASYLLILLALRTGVTSYVLGMRQLSIAGGVALGWHFLREPMTPGRTAGVALILAGCLMLAVAAGR